MQETLSCPKCMGAMTRGHIPDLGHGQVLEARWSEGDPVRRKYVGGIKWQPDAQHEIVAYRCGQCSYVELYAPPHEE